MREGSSKRVGSNWLLPIEPQVSQYPSRFGAEEIGGFSTRSASLAPDEGAQSSEKPRSAVLLQCSCSVVAVIVSCGEVTVQCRRSFCVVQAQCPRRSAAWSTERKKFLALIHRLNPETHCTTPSTTDEWNIKGYCATGVFRGVFRCGTRRRSVLHFMKTCCVCRTRPQHR